MTQDEIVRMAREAGLLDYTKIMVIEIERFAALVAAHEREALAEQTEQEPVAWMNDSAPTGVFARHKEGAENFGCTIPLYAAPVQQAKQEPVAWMNKDEIIRMALELATRHGSRMCDEDGETHGEELYCVGVEDIAEIIKQVAAHVTEACAKVCEEFGRTVNVETWDMAGKDCAAAIRVRGDK